MTIKRDPLMLQFPLEGGRSASFTNQIAESGLRRMVVVLGAAMLAVFAILTWQANVEPDLGTTAEALVGDFFDDLQNGDIEGALAYATIGPDDIAPDFLRPELIGEDWAVTSIEAGEPYAFRPGWPLEVEVAVTIEFDGTAETGHLTVTEGNDDAALLVHPVNQVGVDGHRTLREVRVNGQSVNPVNDWSLPLLPGVYDFDSGAGRLAVFPDTQLSTNKTTTRPDPDEVIGAAQATLDAQADQCAESNTLTATDCNVDLESEDDLPSLGAPADVEWHVSEYLRPTLTPQGGAPSVLIGKTETDGAFEITGTADYRDTPDAPKHRHRFHASCTYTIVSFGPAITPDGTVAFLDTLRPNYASWCELID